MTDLFPSKIAVVALFLGLAAPVAAGPFDDGATAVKTADYATVLRLWLPLAEQGQAWAQLNCRAHVRQRSGSTEGRRGGSELVPQSGRSGQC